MLCTTLWRQQLDSRDLVLCNLWARGPRPNPEATDDGCPPSRGGHPWTVTIAADRQMRGGPRDVARHVPCSARITVTDAVPFDVDIQLNWDTDEQRLVAD